MSYKEIPNIQHNVREQKKAAYFSLFISIILLIAKFWAFNMTGSQAIFSDAMESIVNVVAATLVIFVVAYANQPADRDHPYGHGKIEYFSAAFEGGLISFAALMIIIDAVRSLVTGHELKELNTGLVVVSVAGLINLILGYFLIHIGEGKNSKALIASGKHVISDFWTSFGVILGLLIVKLTDLVWIDSVIAIIVSVFLAKTGFYIVKNSIAGLLDEEDEQALQKVAEIFSKHASKSIIQVHQVKMIRSGQNHHIDAHLVVPEFWDVQSVHKNIALFENRIMRDYPFNLELHFHLDPCRRAYCKACDVDDCHIRLTDFQKRLPINVEQFRELEEPHEYRDLQESD